MYFDLITTKGLAFLELNKLLYYHFITTLLQSTGEARLTTIIDNTLPILVIKIIGSINATEEKYEH